MKIPMMVAALSLAAVGCQPTEAESDIAALEDELQSRSIARASIKDQAGSTIGEAWLVQLSGRVLITASIYTATPGYHGFHVHGVGQCTATFTSAGGHYNPAGATHGAHAGDLPVLLVQADGTAKTIFETDRFTVDELLDADGAAFILHAAADNYANISTRYFSNTDMVAGADTATLATGDAGSRLGCGVITRL